MSLTTNCVVSRTRRLDAHCAKDAIVDKLGTIELVDEQSCGAILKVQKHSFGQFVNKLFKDQIGLGLDFIVQKALTKLVQSTIRRVVVYIERIEQVLEHCWLTLLIVQNVRRQQPRQRHFNWKLQTLRQFKIEFAIPL